MIDLLKLVVRLVVRFFKIFLPFLIVNFCYGVVYAASKTISSSGDGSKYEISVGDRIVIGDSDISSDTDKISKGGLDKATSKVDLDSDVLTFSITGSPREDAVVIERDKSVVEISSGIDAKKSGLYSSAKGAVEVKGQGVELKLVASPSAAKEFKAESSFDKEIVHISGDDAIFKLIATSGGSATLTGASGADQAIMITDDAKNSKIELVSVDSSKKAAIVAATGKKAIVAKHDLVLDLDKNSEIKGATSGSSSSLALIDADGENVTIKNQGSIIAQGSDETDAAESIAIDASEVSKTVDIENAGQGKIYGKILVGNESDDTTTLTLVNQDKAEIWTSQIKVIGKGKVTITQSSEKNIIAKKEAAAGANALDFEFGNGETSVTVSGKGSIIAQDVVSTLPAAKSDSDPGVNGGNGGSINFGTSGDVIDMSGDGGIRAGNAGNAGNAKESGASSVAAGGNGGTGGGINLGKGDDAVTISGKGNLVAGSGGKGGKGSVGSGKDGDGGSGGSGGNIEFGEGNDSLTLSGEGNLMAGDGGQGGEKGGSSKADGTGGTGGSINFGNGNDTVTISGAGKIIVGTGANDGSGANSNSDGNVNFGDGDDILDIQGKGGVDAKTGQINLGSGKDTLIINNADAVLKASSINFGDGDDRFEVKVNYKMSSSVSGLEELKVGFGDNEVSLDASKYDFTDLKKIELTPKAVLKAKNVTLTGGNLEVEVTGTKNSNDEYTYKAGKLEVADNLSFKKSSNNTKAVINVTAKGSFKKDDTIDIATAKTINKDATNNIDVKDKSYWYDFTIKNDDNKKLQLVISGEKKVDDIKTLSDNGKKVMNVVQKINAKSADIKDDSKLKTLVLKQYETLSNDEGTTDQEVTDFSKKYMPNQEGVAVSEAMQAEQVISFNTTERLDGFRTGIATGDNRDRIQFWAEGIYNTTTDSSAQKDGEKKWSYKSKTFGAIAGFDREISRSILTGATLAFSRSNIVSDRKNSDDKTDEGIVDGYHFGIYGTFNTEMFFVDAKISQSMLKNKFDRYIAKENAKSNYTAYLTTGMLAFGTNLILNRNMIVTPKLFAQYSRYYRPGYSETGVGGAGYHFAQKTINDFGFGAEIKAKMRYIVSGQMKMASRVLAGISYYTRPSVSYDANFIDYKEEKIAVKGEEKSNIVYHYGIGQEMEFNDDIKVDGEYRGHTREKYQSHSFKLKGIFSF